MKFIDALEYLKKGYKIKIPEWVGYWKLEDNSIKMHCKDGKVLDITETEDIFYTLGFIVRDDWEIVDGNIENIPVIHTFTFGDALRNLKLGRRVSRRGWNGKGLFVVYQKGYPDGIPCNEQTAEAWGMNPGDLFKCEPYLQINTVYGSHSMWVPSIGDILANDWYLVDNDTKK